MKTVTDKKHVVQKHILSQLLRQKYSRFRDLRPKGIDTNLYSYHLKRLVAEGLVYKTNDGYSISDVAAVTMTAHTARPELAFVIQNSDGDVLLKQRTAQPFADCYMLPGAKLDIRQSSIMEAAQSHVTHEITDNKVDVKHAGDSYVRIRNNDEILSTQLLHIFRFEVDAVYDAKQLLWARPHKIAQYALTPCVEQVMSRTFFKDKHFFEEFTETW